MYCFVIII